MFLKHERADLITFIDMALQFGWGGLIFGVPQMTCASISHDEWIHIRTENDVTAIAKEAQEFGLTILAQNHAQRH
jgi:hypothetical protein